MEDWKRSIVQQWRAERESKPSELERERWLDTINDLRRRLGEAEQANKGDLYTRLVIALIKNEDYSAALLTVEEGLSNCTSEWVDRLIGEKAKALYLSGVEGEAMTLLDRLAPVKTISVKPSGDRSHHRLETEVRMVCPGCRTEVIYGETACPRCGMPVGEGFIAVRRLKGSRRIDPLHAPPTLTADVPRRHRTRKATILFTTIWVDQDDSEHFFNTVTLGLFGRSCGSVPKRWFTEVVLLYLVIINLLLATLVLPQVMAGVDIPRAMAYVAIWAISVLPMASLFAWAVWPIGREDFRD